MVAVLADLPGPKVRSVQFPEGGVVLVGGEVTLVPGEGPSSTASSRSTTRPCSQDLQAGDRVVLGDGAISLRSTRSRPGGAMSCSPGATLQGRPGVHLPAERLRLSTPTDDDLGPRCSDGREGVDFLAVSFVRTAHDLRLVRDAIAPHGTRLVAKIETMPRGRRPRGHRRRGRRGDGGARRPRHRVPAGGRAPPAEADHPPLRRGRRAGHHGDADDGEHDHRRRHPRGPRSATSPTRCSTAPMR